MEEERKRLVGIYRAILILALVAIIAGVGTYQYLEYYKQMPDSITIQAGSEHTIDVQVPAKAILDDESLEVSGFGESNIPSGAVEIDFGSEMTLLGSEECAYEMEVKLFGIFPLKTVSLEVVAEKTLIPAGIPIGIYVKTDGILVIGTGEFIGMDGGSYEPSKNIIQSGDYIQSINGISVTTKGDVVDVLQESGNENVTIEIMRNEELISVWVEAIQCEDGEYKIGVWLRDSAQGIGTMTFIDGNGVFGALGHGITDVDTTTLMNMEIGTLYETSIIAIHKGLKGIPGELTGSIDYATSSIIGEIIGNTEVGIFGVVNETLQESVTQEAIPIGYANEVVIGEAEILCTITGEPEYYDVIISDIDYSGNNVNRNMVIEIVDEELLELTGGIIQGMSGAAIVQNGKIIGAVTHVFVNDPTRGYGIFIESMLETAESIEK